MSKVIYHKLLTSIAPLLNSSNINISNRMLIYSHINEYLSETEYIIKDLQIKMKKLENNILEINSRNNIKKICCNLDCDNCKYF